MKIIMLKSKIHRAKVTQADLNYVGSITIDSELLKKANMFEYEKVQIVDINNGNRFETYIIAGEPGSGIICLNGAAAKCVSVGDLVIIMSYTEIDSMDVTEFKPSVVFVGDNNEIVRVANYERHGLLKDQEV